MRVTIRDVAKKAKVSVSTVSHALNGYSDVSESTRRHILKIAEELNYKPSMMARGLVSGKSNLIGVLLPAITPSFWASILEGIEEVLQEHGYVMAFSNYSTGEHIIEQLEAMRLNNVEAIICATYDSLSLVEEALYAVTTKGIPVVTVTGSSSLYDIPYVKVDEFLGGVLATKHLIERGHTRICCLGQSERVTAGYTQTLLENNIPIDADLVISHLKAWEGGYTAVDKLLSTHFKGALCKECKDVIESEIGRSIFYLAALCNLLDLDMQDIVDREYNRVTALGMFNLT
jgi:LacI family transcriptional regulator